MIIKKPIAPYQAWFNYGGEESFLLRHFEPSDLEDKSDIEIAEVVFADWRGIVDAEGNDVPCTPEFIGEFMKLLEGRERFMWAVKKAIDLNSFIDWGRIEKNSSRPLSGGPITRAQTPATAMSANGNGNQTTPVEPAR